MSCMTLKGELKTPLIATLHEGTLVLELDGFDELWGKPESFKGLPQIVMVDFVIGFLLVESYNGAIFFHYIHVVYYGFC